MLVDNKGYPAMTGIAAAPAIEKNDIDANDKE